MRISPLWIGSKPEMQRSAVVLPQPEGPSRQPIAPSGRVKVVGDDLPLGVRLRNESRIKS
jgi:hypothetical protein